MEYLSDEVLSHAEAGEQPTTQLMKARQVDPMILDDPSVLQDQNAIGEQQRFVNVMGYKNDRRFVVFNQLEQKTMHADSYQGIESAERFVRQQQFWSAQQRPCQCCALFLASGQSVARLCLVAQPHRFQHGESRDFRIGPAQSKRQVLDDADPRQQPRILKQDGCIYRPAKLSLGDRVINEERALLTERLKALREPPAFPEKRLAV
ncbi:hypothetical protein ABIC60_004872 [Phyllobacterium ifriqiyense]